jgi:hypothetical protein
LLGILKKYLKQNPVTGNVETLHDLAVEVSYVPVLERKIVFFGFTNPALII